MSNNMKIYGGYIDNDTQYYEVFCVNCTVDGEKIIIEAPKSLLSVVYMTGTFITKNTLNILMSNVEDNIQYVYGFDKLTVFNIIDTERRKALEHAQYLVNQLEKPTVVKEEN